jgi:arylsulfatase A-like enzyme
VDDADLIRENPKPYFRATLEALDIEIGRLFANMGPAMMAQTDIIFLGDNGTPDEVNDVRYPESRGKGTVYQGGIHVPLVIAGPSVVDGSRRSSTLVNVSDLFATMLEMRNVDWRENLPEGRVVDSQSLLPVLSAEASDDDGREWIMSEVFGPNKKKMARALRIKDHKLIETNEEKELYDLSVDPFEQTNLLEGDLSTESEELYQRMLAISLSRPNP